MSIEEYKILVLNQLLAKKNKEVELFNETVNNVGRDFHNVAINDLIGEGLITNSNIGYKILQPGEDYLTRIKYNEVKPKESSSIHIGHIINGNIDQSDFSNRMDNSFNTQTTKKTTVTNSSKASKIEILYWVVGIALSVCLIIEFFHKYHITILGFKF